MEFIAIISIGIVIWLVYRHIKKLNTILIDKKGYERNGYGDLIHRRVAYNHLYDYPNTHHLRFSEYDVHHIDRNKRNNSIENLKILTREEHKREHGF